jgi:heme exporter protein A
VSLAALALTVKTIALTRGERDLFVDLSFVVNAGEALILRGANGVGKTSLLRVIAGLSVPDDGMIELNGAILKPLSESSRSHIHYVGHANQLKDELTAEENLADALSIDAVTTSIETRLDALNRVGLLKQRQVLGKKLSQGQKRRIGIANLLLNQKPIWLLDEPTNALDDAAVTLMLSVVDNHLANGGLCVIATHLPLALRGPTRELLMRELIAA